MKEKPGVLSKLGTWLIQEFSHWLMQDVLPKRSYLSDFNKIRYEVKMGDVILVDGTHRVSSIIKVITQSAWSHAALYIGRLNDVADPAMRVEIRKYFKGSPDTQLLIESQLGTGTTIVPLATYTNEHVRICRPQGLTHEDAQRVVNFSLHRLGRRYSLRHVFDLFRFLFPWSIFPRRWRSSLFANNALQPTEDICSSMIAAAFGSVRFPILPTVRYTQYGWELTQRNSRLFTPSDFDYSPYFAIIKYPIFSVSGNVPYKHLPWTSREPEDNPQVTEPYGPKVETSAEPQQLTEYNEKTHDKG